jgi:hypothetical protein
MAVIARASLVEYFKDQVEGALAQQRVDAGGATAHYVVQLLAGTLRNDTAAPTSALLDSRPLGLRLAAALDDRCPDQGRALRDVADAALLLGGYFARRAGRTAMPTDYYRRVGGFAYRALGQEPQALAPIFTELAERFTQFAEVLRDVGQRAEMATPAGVLRAVDAWQRSPDQRLGRLLVERGVVLHRGRVRLQ